MAEERRAVRATLEDCISNQGTLYDLLDELVDAKRPLHQNERHKFIELIDRALMGQGTGVKMEKIRLVDTEMPEGVDIENAEDMLSFMALVTSERLTDDDGTDYPIGKLWKLARVQFLRVRPIAIKAAAAMSAEQWYRRGGTPPDKV